MNESPYPPPEGSTEPTEAIEPVMPAAEPTEVAPPVASAGEPGPAPEPVAPAGAYPGPQTQAPQAPAPPPPVAPPPVYTWQQPTEVAGPAPGIRFAGYAPRLVAYIIDGILLGLAITVLSVVAVLMLGLGATSTDQGTTTVSGGSVLGFFIVLLIVFVVTVFYFPFFWARGGQTPGMRLFRLRVVRDRDGGPISGGTAMIRLIGLWISGAVFYLGYIWVFIDGRRRGWHDLLAGTVVIET